MFCLNGLRPEDSPRVYFECDFFRAPQEGFTIEWTNGVIDGGFCNVVRNHKPCHESCMKGIVVKLSDPHHVWILTGESLTRSDGGAIHLLGYEAVWPD